MDECECDDDGLAEAIDNLIMAITMRARSTPEPGTRLYLKAAIRVATSARERLRSGETDDARAKFDLAFGLLHSVGTNEVAKKHHAVENLLRAVVAKAFGAAH
jgi:hypothetical protein